jgi:Lar family restriction alleviation protein
MALFWQNSRARGGTASENWADDIGAHVTDIEAIPSETIPEILKPCPFCGGRAYFVRTGHGLGYAIRCGQCSARVESDAGKNDAIRQWQSRAHERVP